MSDPAIEAAHVAVAFQPYPGNYLTGSALATKAAREALKPIRAWYGRVESTFEGQRDDVAQMVMLLLGELAPLIYTTEELES